MNLHLLSDPVSSGPALRAPSLSTRFHIDGRAVRASSGFHRALRFLLNLRTVSGFQRTLHRPAGAVNVSPTYTKSRVLRTTAIQEFPYPGSYALMCILHKKMKSSTASARALLFLNLSSRRRFSGFIESASSRLAAPASPASFVPRATRTSRLCVSRFPPAPLRSAPWKVSSPVPYRVTN